jgi:small subunit ribosomal protein S19e
VKTGVHKQRPPYQDDWWHIRCAALLRTVYLRGPIGIERLRSKYGGRQERGTKKEKFRKGSGNVIRKCLQQLEKAELVKKTDKKRGRVVTKKGMSILDKLSAKISRKM